MYFILTYLSIAYYKHHQQKVSFIIYHLYPKVPFQNKWKKKTTGIWPTQVHLEKDKRS